MRRILPLFALFVLLPLSAWGLLRNPADDAPEPAPDATEVEIGSAHRPGDAALASVDIEDAAWTPDALRTEVAATVAGNVLVLTGRILDRVDVPLRRAAVQGLLRGGPQLVHLTLGGDARTEFTTDEDGRFEWPLASRRWSDSTLGTNGRLGGVELVVTAYRDGRMTGATVQLPRSAPTGSRFDVGDIVWTRWPLLCSGRIVNDVGVAVADAHVTAHQTTVATQMDVHVARPASLNVGVRLSAGGSNPTFRLSQSLDRQAELFTQLHTVNLQLETSVLAARASTPNGVAIARLTNRLSALRFQQSGMKVLVGHQLESIGPIAETRTRDDGSFELYAPAPELPLEIRVTATQHRSATEPLAGLGQWLEVALFRTASTQGTAILPDWLPATAVEFRLDLIDPQNGEDADLGKDGETMAVTGALHDVSFAFSDLDPGSYELFVRVDGMPHPLLRVPALRIDPGPERTEPRLQHLDLRNLVHRFALRAVDDSGHPLTKLPSPLLAHTEAGWRGFNWTNGQCEIFAPTPQLEVQTICAGFRTESSTVHSGTSNLIFRRLHPIEVHLPGLRALSGQGRKVRVSMILEGDTKLPQGIRGLAQRTGQSRSYSRWHLTKSGGAWLGNSDIVQVPLVHNGTYRVMVRLHHEGASGDVSLNCGNHEVVLDDFGPRRILVSMDDEEIRNAITQLEARANQ